MSRSSCWPRGLPTRAAFNAFGAKPKPAPQFGGGSDRPRLEGEALPRVSVRVDRYNAISVRHVVPVGGADADRLQGPLRLTVAAGGELFDPPGDGIDIERVPAGEIVWGDDCGVTGRFAERESLTRDQPRVPSG